MVNFFFFYRFSSSDRKVFDAFVSYAKWSSSESEASSSLSEEYLALNLFPEVLENKYGYNLCLLERDVAPGGGRSCAPRGELGQKGQLNTSALWAFPSFLLLGYMSSGKFHELRIRWATAQENMCCRAMFCHPNKPVFRKKLLGPREAFLNKARVPGSSVGNHRCHPTQGVPSAL